MLKNVLANYPKSKFVSLTQNVPEGCKFYSWMFLKTNILEDVNFLDILQKISNEFLNVAQVPLHSRLSRSFKNFLLRNVLLNNHYVPQI